MKAVYINGHGGPEVVEVGERPLPEPGPGEVRVRVAFAGFNHVDLYMRNSGAGITHELPLILGVDGVGAVDRAGDGVEGLAAGAPVLIYPAIHCNACEFCVRGDQMLCTTCRIPGEHVDGTFAEYICVPANTLLPLPESLAPEKAAILPTALLTAWRMIMTQAVVRPWETVLLHGVGGGVALSAMQFVKLTGARAIVTSGAAGKLAQARALGADATVNYREDDVVARVMEFTGGRGVDVVVDNVGGDTWGVSLKCLVRGGRLVTCGATTGPRPPADLQRIFIRQLKISGSTLGNREELRQLVEVAASGAFEPVIDGIWEMDTVHDAMDRMEKADQFGKMVLRVGG